MTVCPSHSRYESGPSGSYRSALTWIVSAAAAVVTLAISSQTPVRAAEFGVYEGGGCDGAIQLENFRRWSGYRPDRVLEFVAFDNWKQVEGSLSWALGCWRTHGHPALTITIPLTTKGIDLADIAAGHYDQNFARLGQMLVASGYGDAILRLGPEMNAAWFPWGNLADRDPSRQKERIAVYKSAFARIVGVFRGASSHFLIDWCPGSGNQQVAQSDVYPGDDVVDIVGTDLYAVVWGVDHPDAAQVKTALSKGWQLDAVAAFGARHGKPISFPEWGVGDRPVGKANFGPGDSSEVMAYLIDWFGAHAAKHGRVAKAGEIIYTDYWDFNAGDYNSRVSHGERPQEGAVLKAALDAGTLVGR
jgi:hypothetical protein